ncbi:hypothetical protein ACW7G0_08250 [Lysobacter sp. A286]
MSAGEVIQMEFHVSAAGPLPDADAVEAAIRELDPSALVDVDPTGQLLRIAASIDSTELVSLINQAGYPVTPEQVRQLPSICCGGCSG